MFSSAARFPVSALSLACYAVFRLTALAAVENSPPLAKPLAGGSQTPSSPAADSSSTVDPAYAPLSRAYEALKTRDYAAAIEQFLVAIHQAPERAAIRKDLAYTYLKVGENEAAREQFGEAMRINPPDFHVALEYAFLSFETPVDPIPNKAMARRIFDRVRKSGDTATRATAEQAFHNIDAPLEAGITRWQAAIAQSNTFSAHFELAQLAEQRDELELAADHYLTAWQLLPERRYVLVDLGRVLHSLNRLEEANAALLAASRGGEPRAAESARYLMPGRYPYVYEFRKALELDPSNLELHRELAYLLMSMAESGQAKPEEAETEFRGIIARAPDDLLSTAQLGFLCLARKDNLQATPLLQRVLDGNDQELVNRVRTALHMPVQLSNRDETTGPVDARAMAEKSLKAGYLKDALRYLRIAQENDPVDFSLMLKLAWAYNMLHDDATALRWFDLARKSPDAKVSSEATKAYKNLEPTFARFRTTLWAFPVFSTRWHDLFSYGQAKTEVRIGQLPIRPYLSVRFVGDTRQTIPGGVQPQYLSESAFIFAAGVGTKPWHGVTAWAEAGEAVGYLNHHVVPDYRGGLSWARYRGVNILANESGWFYGTNSDAVFISRFDNDTIAYWQNRSGYTLHPVQFYWNGNLTVDAKRQAWANFMETGPGFKFHPPNLPNSLVFSLDAVRGVYLINAGNPHKPNFYDVRIGLWYALTR